MPAREFREVRQPWLRAVLLAAGWLSVALGVIGIFLPVLPTTPFLLLAAACFVRSSQRVYIWLVTHPRLGPWIRDYLDGEASASEERAVPRNTTPATFAKQASARPPVSASAGMPRSASRSCALACPVWNIP